LKSYHVDEQTDTHTYKPTILKTIPPARLLIKDDKLDVLTERKSTEVAALSRRNAVAPSGEYECI